MRHTERSLSSTIWLVLPDAGGLRTLAEVQAAEQKLREAASNKKFPQLLDEVKKRLTSPLHYERELLSLQDVRNCLEHREGIVQERGAGSADD